MRVVESAIWTSVDPVSLSARLYSAISLPLTSVSAAKLRKSIRAQQIRPSGREFGAPVGARVGARAPGAWPVDQDHVRVSERVMFRRHQLKASIRPGELRGMRVVSFDGGAEAIRLHSDPGSRHRLRGLESVVDQVYQHLRLQLRLAVATPRG